MFPNGKMCELLKISRSGYYDWLKRPMSKRKRKYKATINSNHKLPVAENILNQTLKLKDRVQCG